MSVLLNPRTALAAALSSVLLACGGGSDDRPVETISVQPLAVALRPGEVETLRFERDQPDTLLFPPNSDFGSIGWLDFDFTEPCAVPDPGCQTLRLTANGTDGSRPADRLIWPFTYDPFSRTFAHSSYAPVNPFPAAPAAAPPAVRMAAGESLSVALDADGQAWAWGSNRSGAMGMPDASYRSQPTRVQFTPALPPLRAVDVSPGSGAADDLAFVVALDQSNRVWMWGELRSILGEVDATAPYPVELGSDKVIAVAAGRRFALGLRDDGTVWGWGFNFVGQLGNGSETSGVVAAPTRVLGLSNIIAIAAGDQHALALDAQGGVWAWGDNTFGQAGGDARTVSTPRRVTGLGAVSALDAGTGYSLAVRSDGSTWAWGRGDQGQLGATVDSSCMADGEAVRCSRQPVRAGPGLDQVDMVAAGTRFALARQRDGTVWAWGNNEFSQLGGLPGLGSVAPVRVSGLGPVFTIAAGARHALAVPLAESCAVGNGRVGGRLMAWGDNFVGERGDGTAVNGIRPTPVLTLGDDGRCAATIGQRLLVILSGTATGDLTSSAPGMACTGVLCWQTVPDGSRVTLTAAPHAGADMGDWRWDCAAAGASNTAAFDMTAPRHCKLRFTQAGTAGTRTLRLRVVGDGRVVSSPTGLDCTSDCSASFPTDAVISLTPTPAPGAAFVEVGGDVGCSATLTLDRDLDCSVGFTDAPVTPTDPTLTVTVSAGGRVSTTPAGLDCGPDDTCSQAFAPGTPVQLNVAADAGFRFEAFGGDAACVGGGIVLAADTQCSVSFVAQSPAEGFVLSVQRTGPGAAGGQVVAVSPAGSLDCGNVCDATYAAGSFVSLRATALADGIFFSHWTGCSDTGIDEDGSVLCIVLMNASRTVQADFE